MGVRDVTKEHLGVFLRTKRMVRWQRGNAYDCRSYLREFDSHLNLLFALIFGG